MSQIYSMLPEQIAKGKLGYAAKKLLPHMLRDLDEIPPEIMEKSLGFVALVIQASLYPAPGLTVEEQLQQLVMASFTPEPELLEAAVNE